MATANTKTNQKTLSIVGQSREIVQRTQNTVEMTEEVYGKLNRANQVMIGIHEKYIGEVTEVVQYTNGYGLTNEVIDAVNELLLA